MIDWRAALMTAAVELMLAVGGDAALTPALWGWPDDDVGIGGECFARCTATPPRLVVFDLPAAPAVPVGAGIGIVPSTLCPVAARFDRGPRVVGEEKPPRSEAPWAVCLRVDADGRIGSIGRIDTLLPSQRQAARRFAAGLRFTPAIRAGRAIPTWIRLQVRASDPLAAIAGA